MFSVGDLVVFRKYEDGSARLLQVDLAGDAYVMCSDKDGCCTNYIFFSDGVELHGRGYIKHQER
jgi:hypothetical protein